MKRKNFKFCYDPLLQKWLFALMLLLVMYFSFRQGALSVVNAPYNEDEAFSFYVLKEIVNTGLPVVETGQIYWRSVIAHYVMSVPLLFADSSVNVARIAPFWASLVTIPLVYFSAASTGSRFFALLAAAFIALSDFQQFHITARFYLLFQLFFVFSVYHAMNYFVLNRAHSGRWFVLMSLLAIGCHELSFQLMIVVMVGIVVGKRWQIVKKKSFLLSGLLLAGFYFVLNVYVPRSGYQADYALSLHLFGMQDDLYFYETLKSFFPLGFSVLALGLFPRFYKENKRGFYYCAVFFFILMLTSVLSPREHIRYVAHAFPIMAIAVASVLSFYLASVIDGLKRPKYDHLLRSFLLPVAVFLVCIVTFENTDIASAFEKKASFVDHAPYHKFLKQYIGAGDVLISTSPQLSQIYLNRPVQYFLREKHDERTGAWMPFSEEEKKRHSQMVIDSSEAFLRILEETDNRIWIYRDYKDFSYGPGIRRIIDANFRRVFALRYGTVFYREAR